MDFAYFDHSSHRRHIKKLATGVSAAVICASLVGSAESANAASLATFLTPTSSTNYTINTSDVTWDMNATAVTDNQNIVYKSNAGDVNVLLTVTSGSGSKSDKLATISLTGDTASGDTHALVLGDGVNAVTLEVGAIVGDSPDDDTEDLQITINASGGSANSTLTVTGDLDVNSKTITLNDGTGGNTGDAILQITGAAEQTITGKIDGESEGDGTLNINDASDNTAPDADTFKSAIGSVQDLLAINIGTATLGGNGVFESTVGAQTITIVGGNGGNENSVGNFQAEVTATNIKLNDTASGGTATLTLSGTSAFNVTGAISGSDDTDGNITVTNTSAGGIILGASGNAAITTTFDATSNNVTVTGAISGASANDTNALVIAGGANRVIFATDMGSNIDTVTINNSSVLEFNGGGTATSFALNNATSEIEVDIDTAGETYTGTINGASAGVGILDIAETGGQIATFASAIGGTNALASITVGSSTTNENSTALFNDNVTATAIVLGDITNTNTVLAHFQTDANGTNHTVTGTIDEIASGTDTVEVRVSDTNAGTADTVTFASAIGATYAIDTLTVGDAANNLGGYGIFNSTVAATTITVDAQDTGDAAASVADFNAAITATSINISAGSAAAEAATVTASSDITATTITLNDGTSGNATLTLDGSSAQTVTGNIVASAAGEGTLNINNNATFTGNIGATRLEAITIASGKTATLGVAGSTKDFGATTITNSGTIKALDSLKLASGTNLTLGNNSTIQINNHRDIASGESVIDAKTNSATVTIASGSTVNLEVLTNMRSGSLVVVDASDGGTLTNSGSFSVTDSFVTDYSVSTTGDKVTITATSQPGSVIAAHYGLTADEGSAFGQALAATDSTATADTATAYDTAITAGSSEVQKAAKQSQNTPGVLAASSATMVQTGSASLGASSTHLASGRSADAYASVASSGIASGGAYSDAGQQFWTQAFGQLVNQDKKDGIDGYDATTYGVAVGLDLLKQDDLTVGVAFSYATTNVDGDGVAQGEADIDSYQGSIYAGYTQPDWYVEGLVGYAHNSTESTRVVNFSGLNRTLRGEYDGNQYMAKINAGMPLAIDTNAYFTPSASFFYAYVDNDSYTETGGGASNLTVNPDSVSVAELSFGGKIHTIIEQPDHSKIIPELRVRVLYDFAGDEASSSSSYVAGGSAFEVSAAEVAQFGGAAGLGLSYQADNVELSIGYDAEIRSDYLAHTGMVEARLGF